LCSAMSAQVQANRLPPALLSPLDHRLRRTDVSLTKGSGGFDIDDDAELDVHSIVTKMQFVMCNEFFR
jgi:hypothetical protein